MIEPEPLQQVERTYVRLGKRKLSYFGGCDYFRLASHPKVIAALHDGADRYGLNVAASRLTTGNHALYYKLEDELAAFFAVESATLISGGYLANLVAAQALAGNFSHALIDEKAHPSLSDAARFLDCPTIRFRHADVDHVASTVRRFGPGSKLILLTDGMYSNDGSTAPLKEYLKILPADAMILLDDAHGAGVLGKTGKGTPEYAGVNRERIIQTITLSKAFGSYGGAVLGRAHLRKRIRERSYIFIGSTPLPLPLANASLESVKILRTEKAPKARLANNTNYIKGELRKTGFPLAEAPGPIVPVLPRQEADVLRLRANLLRAGIYPTLIKYPGGPEGGYFRFVISSEHTPGQLKKLLKVLGDYQKSHTGRGK